MSALTCREAAARLGDHLDRELPPARRAAVDAHLAACARCVAYARSYERAVRLAKRAFDGEDAALTTRVPPGLLDAVLTALRLT